MRRSHPSDRRRALRRDILKSLALVAAIFVSILALPFGRVHEGACRVASKLSGRGPDMPCGLMALRISIDTDRSPYLSIAVTPLKLPISL